jgi:kynurenine 3-monooxygenase
MDSSAIPTHKTDAPSEIAFVGGGPAALSAAIALARRGVRTSVFERDQHPAIAPRFNPDRSYTIDISGHGLKALRHIDACAYFDDRMIQFKGLKIPGGGTEEWISVVFECRVNSVDVQTGTLTYDSKSDGTPTKRFDLVIGADGAGSVVRKAMLDQVPGFIVQTKSFPNYCTMIELDRVGDQLNKNYLHGLSARPFCVAGAIKGDQGSDTPRWFCAVGTKAKQVFSSTDGARRFFRERLPRVLELTGDEKVAAFAQRTCYHIGQTLTCSQLHGGKAVLIGDAAAAFPPIGQGVNAAMESGMVLDLCIAEAGRSPTELLEAGRLYNTRWKPEVDAVSWMSVRSLFENRYHMLRATITARLGVSIFGQAKSEEIPYSEVRRKAERRWPLWA